MPIHEFSLENLETLDFGKASVAFNLIRLSRIESHHALRRVGADGKTYRVATRAKRIDATSP